MNKINICLTIIIIVLLILFIINLSNYDKFAVTTQSNDNPSQTSQINSICEIRSENTCLQGEQDKKCIWDPVKHICYTNKQCSDLKNKINCITGAHARAAIVHGNVRRLLGFVELRSGMPPAGHTSRTNLQSHRWASTPM